MRGSLVGQTLHFRIQLVELGGEGIMESLDGLEETCSSTGGTDLQKTMVDVNQNLKRPA